MVELCKLGITTIFCAFIVPKGVVLVLFFPRSALVVSRYAKGWAPYLSVLSYEAFKRIVCRVCDMLWPVRHIIACFFVMK